VAIYWDPNSTKRQCLFVVGYKRPSPSTNFACIQILDHNRSFEKKAHQAMWMVVQRNFEMRIINKRKKMVKHLEDMEHL
jgi:hypothetical protein